MTQIQTSDITDGSITAAKLAAGAAVPANNSITPAQLTTANAGAGLVGGNGTPLAVNVDGLTLQIVSDVVSVLSIGTSNIANNAITSTLLNTSVAGNGLTGGGGSALAVNVDNSTLQITGNTISIKPLGITTGLIADGAITAAKLSTTYVGGSGSTSQMPKFTSGSTIGNSLLADNGTPIGLAYTMSTGGQLFTYFTYNDLTSALFANEAFTSHVANFNSSTNVCTLPAFSGSLVIVNGYTTSAERSFTDLILVSAVSNSTTAAFTVIANNSVGSPGTRTYGMSQRTLTMSISDSPAHTYNVGVKVTSVQ